MDPQSTDKIQNVLFNNSMNIFQSLSFYAPLIICTGVIMFSMFNVIMEKAFVFFIWIFIITFLRIIVFKGIVGSDSTTNSGSEIPSICYTGLTEIFIPKDFTYSVYILTFTMMYFVTPMIMVSKQNNINAINYGVIGFFVAYIMLDLFVKNSLGCISGFFNSLVITDIVAGLFLGGFITGLLMYGSNLKTYLYINEVNSNKEVCSTPSKQQFRCSLYRNGELVGNV